MHRQCTIILHMHCCHTSFGYMFKINLHCRCILIELLELFFMIMLIVECFCMDVTVYTSFLLAVVCNV